MEGGDDISYLEWPYKSSLKKYSMNWVKNDETIIWILGEREVMEDKLPRTEHPD